MFGCSDVDSFAVLDVETSNHSDVQKSKSGKPSKNLDVSTSKHIKTQTSKTAKESTSEHPNIQISKAKSNNPDYTRTTIYLPKKMHKKLKAIAVEEEKEMSEIIEELLGDWLESK